MQKDSYEDILFLEHPTSLRHPRMSVQNRAAQFAPFAALTGYEEALWMKRQDRHRSVLFWMKTAKRTLTGSYNGCLHIRKNR